jgi:MAP/microtubule affinity-regulating kinase
MSSQVRPSKRGVEEGFDYSISGIGNYGFVKTLGEGNFAKVKLAKHRLTGQEVSTHQLFVLLR